MARALATSGGAGKQLGAPYQRSIMYSSIVAYISAWRNSVAARMAHQAAKYLVQNISSYIIAAYAITRVAARNASAKLARQYVGASKIISASTSRKTISGETAAAWRYLVGIFRRDRVTA